MRHKRTANDLAVTVGGFAVAVASVICATVVWPADLAWGLLGSAWLAILAAGRFELVFENDDELEQREERR